MEHYFLRWRERRHARHETFGLLVLERILTPEVTAWLVDADPEIMQGLLSAVAGIDDGAVLGSLVTEADRASVERDLRENHIDPAATSLGVPVDRYLLDAMRRLARGGRWQINVPGARLWMLADGLHVVWPAGAEDMVGAARGRQGPRHPPRPRHPGRHPPGARARDPAAGGRPEPPLLAPGAGAARPRRAGRHALHAASGLARAGARGGAPGTGGSGACVRGRQRWRWHRSRRQRLRQPSRREEATSEAEEGHGARGRHAVLSGSRIRQSRRAEQPVMPAGRPLTVRRGLILRRTDCLASARAWLSAHKRGRGATRTGRPGETVARRPPPGCRPAVPAGRRCSPWRRSSPPTRPLGINGYAERASSSLCCSRTGLRVSVPRPRRASMPWLQNGLLDVNPLTPLRRVIEIDGKHGALLTLEASRSLRALTAYGRTGSGAPIRQSELARRRRAPLDGRDHETGDANGQPLHIAKAPRPDDPDPARTLVERIKVRDRNLPGGVSQTDGWLSIGPRDRPRAGRRSTACSPTS